MCELIFTGFFSLVIGVYLGRLTRREFGIPNTPRYSVGGNGVVTVKVEDLMNCKEFYRHLNAARKINNEN